MGSAKVLEKTTELAREDWLEIRRQGIGGSDAASIAGLNPWRPAVAVYMEKRGEDPFEEEQNEAMYWGTRLEDLVAQEFQERTGKKVWRRNAVLQHPEHEFVLANIDRRVVGEEEGLIPLEVKTTSAWNREEWEDDVIPDMYAIQVQHYIAVCGAPYAYIAVLIGGNKFRWARVERDDEAIRYLIQIEKNFWENHVLAGEPPALDGSDASSELVAKMYPEAKPNSELVLPREARPLIEQRQGWKEREEEAKEHRKAAENKLKDMLGEKEIGLFEGEPVVRWTQVTSKRIDSKKLREQYPEVAEECEYESSYRRLTVNG